MILKSFKNYLGLLIILILQTPLLGEEKIDIWKNNKKNSSEINSSSPVENEKNKDISNTLSINTDKEIKIEEGSKELSKDEKIYGVYDPEDFDFNLNMWSSTNAEDVRARHKRKKKINLTKTSQEILESVCCLFRIRLKE